MSWVSLVAKGLILVGAGAVAKMGLDYVDQKSKEGSEDKEADGNAEAGQNSRESAEESSGQASVKLADPGIRQAAPRGAKRLMGQCEACGKPRADIEDRCERSDCPHR